MVKTQQDRNDFGILCICALRYCQGRQSYMPSMVQGIVRNNLQSLEKKDLRVIACDLNEMAQSGWEHLYGDPVVDKPGWLKFQADVEEELKRRERGGEEGA